MNHLFKSFLGLEHPNNIEKVVLCITLCPHPHSGWPIVSLASLAQLAKAFGRYP
ncbi:MAG: hypothetical protein LBM00_04870 [Deltaproteobacteria bacterium]|nr:hypothetical protein [Deltaproteobacteria bacterium]